MRTTKGFPFSSLPEYCKKMNPDLFRRKPVDVPSATKLSVAPQTEESKLNKLEKAWLTNLRITFPWVGIQCMTLKLGDDCRYTPDFIVINASGELLAYECKGFWRDDALVKIKTAARMYRWIKFITVQKVNGQFEAKQVNP